MIVVIILCAVLCAAATLTLIAPVARTRPRLCYALMVIIPCASLGLYLFLGAPGLPSQPALFDTDPQNLEARALVSEELEAMKALSEDPDNIMNIMRLAGLRIGQGHFEDAERLLRASITRFPDEENLKMQLGAALFAHGLLLAENQDFPNSILKLEDALEITPEAAPFRTDIPKIIDALKGEDNKN